MQLLLPSFRCGCSICIGRIQSLPPPRTLRRRVVPFPWLGGRGRSIWNRQAVQSGGDGLPRRKSGHLPLHPQSSLQTPLQSRSLGKNPHLWRLLAPSRSVSSSPSLAAVLCPEAIHQGGMPPSRAPRMWRGVGC
jgi:hypothetical protein